MPMKYARLTEPLVRDDGVLAPRDLGRGAGPRRRGLPPPGRRATGRTRFGMLSCSKATNEVNFLAQKFTRVAIGTNNIDSCNRT